MKRAKIYDFNSDKIRKSEIPSANGKLINKILLKSYYKKN